MSDTVNQIMIWIPVGYENRTKNDGLEIAETMIKKLKVKKINSKSYSNFRELFTNSGSSELTFCGENLSTDYLLEHAEDELTLLSVRQLKTDLTITEIYAMLVFKVDKTKVPSHLEVIAFCGNADNKMAKGHGTKLLNLVKQSMSLAKIDNIILNPVPEAIPYYVKQFFKVTEPGDDFYLGESNEVMKSHLPTERRLRKSLKPRSPKPRSASHSQTSRRRSASSSSKRRSSSSSSKRRSSSSFTFYRPSSHERLSNSSNLGRPFKSPKSKKEYAKIKELCSFFCLFCKDKKIPIEGNEKVIVQRVETDFSKYFKSADNPNPKLNDSQMKYLNELIESCK
jgi:hypothetical protein